ncbi:MAG: hypothetical protein AB8G86_21430 [Saprospiraceae bacterium]
MKQLPNLLSNFEEIFQHSIQETWEAKNLPVNLEVMAKEASSIGDTLVEIGDFCYQQLTEQTAELTAKQQFDYSWMNFEWANLAKDLMILWRDILFQQQKGQIIKIDRLTTASALRTLNLASLETLEKALYDFKGDVERGLNIPLKKKTKKIAQWQLQQNPWPVYKQQLSDMANQCLRLQKDYRVLLNVASNFNEIEALVRQTENFCQEEISNVQKIANETVAEIEQEELPKLSKIIKHLEDLEAGISLPNHFNTFTEALEHRINELITRTDVPVNANGGMVEIKDLTFKRSSKQWLDAEILPLLYEVWELTENTHNGLKMALINIKNRAILLDAEEKEGKKVDVDKVTISQPLNTFYKNSEQASDSLIKLRAEIHHRLANIFNVSAIYEPNRAFLPVPIQEATLNQFRKGQNRIQNRVGKWVNGQWKRFQNLRATVAQEDALSDAEKIVRLIQSRTGDETNSNYASIFLTKGFIGESFAVGRQRELVHAKNLIDNWRDNYRGAAVITGERFSGKTILGELIATQFFNNNTIRLAPNTLIKLNGRRMTTGFDLEPVLAFIKKYTTTKEPPLIWIDDLELWWDKDLPLSQNVRTLRKFIDNNGNRLFFLVSMSNWLNTHLNLFHETSKVFQAEINVDKMSLEEIREAIMIRHGATHKKLINTDREALSPNEFKRLIDKIYRISGGNIGEALNRWSCATARVDEENVRHIGGVNFGLPDFLNPDVAILLSAIMIEKRTSEYRLRIIFGPSFTEKYAPILQRLIGIGLLRRQLDGWLEINEVLVNELGHLLEDKGYLKYHREALK